MVYCCVVGYKSNSSRRKKTIENLNDDSISVGFHQFPSREKSPERYKTWLGHCTLSTQGQFSPRIVGGENAATGFFPYQVSVKKANGEHICNGVIIKTSIILTTAHNVYDKSSTSLNVLVGTIQLSKGGSSYPVKEIKVHDRFNSYSLKNDIALLKLFTDIVLSSESYPIALGTSFVGGGVNCVLSSWGYRQTSGSLSDYLQYIFLKTISVNECSQKLDKPIDQSQLCTLTEVGEGPCYMDSGSPLVSGGFVIGIVSSGKPCAIGFPDVYTRISYYNNWIAEHAY